jgi:hypothetical protein
MGTLRQRTAVLEAALAQVAEAMHHGKVGAGGLEHAGKYCHIPARFPGFSRELNALPGRCGYWIAIEPAAGESKFFEPRNIE